MTLLEQCRIWNKNHEYKNVIVAIESLEEKYKSPKLDLELACAYNNIGDKNHIQYFQKAYSLLIKHKKLFKDDYTFNFRLAYAYYFLEEKTKAFYHFKKAYDERPGDRISNEFMLDCIRQLSFPIFEKTYEDRVSEAWDTFTKEEEELVKLSPKAREERILAILKKALRGIDITLCGEREIVLHTDWNKAKLFKIQYLYSKMPEDIKSNWVISLGRQPLNGESLRKLKILDSDSQVEYSIDDFIFWLEEGDILIYSDRIKEVLKSDEKRAYNITDEIMINIFGEITILALEPVYTILREPRSGDGKPLYNLLESWEASGRVSRVQALDYLNTSVKYDLLPKMEDETPIREDIYIGTTSCPALINEYSKSNFGDVADVVDGFTENGIGVGYISYPMYFLKDKEGFVNEIRKFNTKLMKWIVDFIGNNEVTFIGGATGLKRCYIDFISWGDMTKIFGALIDFFANDEIFDVHFQCFRSGFPSLDIFAEETYV